jgi:hypothetical protein
VASVGTDRFVVTTRAGTTVTVDVTSATTYRDLGATSSSASFSDITTGEFVGAAGTESGGVLTATTVFIAPAGFTPGHFGAGGSGPGGGGRFGGAGSSGSAPTGPAPTG